MAERIRDDVDVLVFDTESRHLSRDFAAERVAQVVERAAHWEVQIVKRIDTTLRGNISSEVAAGLHALRAVRTAERHVALVVPAFPASGRITVGGMQMVDGLPVHRSSAAADPLNPVVRSSVAGVIAEQSDLTVATIGLDDITDGLHQQLLGMSRQFDAVVVDSITDADISVVAEAAKRVAAGHGIRWLVVDTGPFGAALATESCLTATRKVAAPLILVIGGSTTDETSAQLDHLVSAVGAALITLGPGRPDTSSIVDQLRQLSMEGASVVGVRTSALGQAPSHARSAQVLSFLGEITRRAVGQLRPDGVYTTGGDVGTAVLGALEGDGLRVVDEVLPSAVIGSIIGGPFAGIGFATKGGLIGGRDAATRCVTALRQGVSRTTGAPVPAAVASVTKAECR